MANELAKAQSTSFATYLGNENVRNGIAKVVSGKRMDGFVTSIVSATQANPALSRCTNQSILSVALMGESLQLPPSPQLGYYYFVPYKSKKNIGGQWVETEEAQFQLGWRGYIQLAIRSGMYRNIVVNAVKDGEAIYNPITEDITLNPIMDPEERAKAKTIGYYAMFELTTGFRKQVFRPYAEIYEHAKTYSKSFRYDLSSGKKTSVWSTNFDAMAKKTLIRQLLSKWGIMSVEMQNAFVNDMSVIDEDGSARYVDNPPVDVETQVQQDIAEHANSVDFEEELPINPPTPEAVKAAEEMPETPKRGRKKAEPKPEPAPAVVEAVPVDDGPDWM